MNFKFLKFIIHSFINFIYRAYIFCIIWNWVERKWNHARSDFNGQVLLLVCDWYRKECKPVTNNLDAMRYSTNNMIDLIFNQLSAFQNETMERLTFATIVFLPLTFLTGYFGQNFKEFPELDYSPAFFWKIAIPSVVAVMLVLS